MKSNSHEKVPVHHGVGASPHARPLGVLVTAGSAGGLSPLRALLSSLPANFPVPVVVVQHRSAQQPNLLSRLLERTSVLPVKRAIDTERLEPGTIYVAPPDFHVELEHDGKFHLFDGKRIKHVRSSANPLFDSAARAFGPGVIAVVLSGSGSDGTDGVQAVKRHGGTVIVEGWQTAGYFSMPQAAIASGAVDYVLPIVEIGPLIVQLVQARMAD